MRHGSAEITIELPPLVARGGHFNTPYRGEGGDVLSDKGVPGTLTRR